MGLLMLVRVLDDEAEAEIANVVLRRAEDPNAGLVHVDEGIDALTGAEQKRIDGLRRWHGIAVEREDAKFMAGKRYAAIFDRAGIEHVYEQAVALLYAKLLAKAQRLVVD